MLYRYWTVRYVPDSVRPDTVGVGVIVADEQNTDSASRFVTKVSDIPNIGGPRKEFLASLNGLREDLKLRSATQSDLDPTSTVNGFVERARRQGHGILQIDPARPAVGISAQAIADDLYRRIIDRSHEARAQNLTRVRSMVREGYEGSYIVEPYLAKKPKLEVLGDSVTVDLAVLGENYTELNSAFSFLADPSTEFRNRLKAFIADMNEVREGNVSVLQGADKKILHLSEDTPVIGYFEEPQGKEQGRLFESMLKRWEQIGVTPLSVDQAPEHVLEVEHKLQKV